MKNEKGKVKRTKRNDNLSVDKLSFLFGGEKGIRTPETLLTPTRFPIVRLRPAQPSLLICVSYKIGLAKPKKHFAKPL